MKKTTLVIILLAVMIVSCLALTACHTCEFGEWTVAKQATCTEDGQLERSCSCGEKETSTLPATGHTFGEWAIAENSTCTKLGQEQRTCSCGEKETRDIPLADHSFDEWVVVSNATCTEAGLKVGVCDCGESKSEIIAAIGHSYEAVVTDPTCTEQGYTTHTCSGCGDSYVDTYVDALGHSYTSVVTEPTCTKQGYTTHYCVRCYHNYKDTYVDAKGHNYVNSVCTECGIDYSTGLEYTLNGKSYTVSGIGTCIDTSIVIPKQYNNKPVTSIGEYAFWACSNLTSITIPDSVTSIGDYAFYCCTGLTSITIPDSVTTIGGEAFYGCMCFISIIVDGNNPNYQSIDGNLYTKDGKTLIQYATGKTDTSFIIPNGVTSIGNSAFSFCRSLTSITIPDSVTSIGDEAFCGCIGFISIIVDGNNPNYQSIDGNLYTKDGKTLIQYATGKTDTSFIIPNGVTSIGKGAFYHCYSLTSITIPDSVTSIGKEAFDSCRGLTSITIPDSVTSIGKGAFDSCRGLTSITIPDSVTSIEGAFLNCTNLTSVTFEDPYGWFWTNAMINGVPIDGTSLTLTDASRNATYLRDTYHYGWWYKTN